MNCHLSPRYGHVTLISCQLTIIWMSILSIIKLNKSHSLPHQLESFTFHINFAVVRQTSGRTVT